MKFHFELEEFWRSKIAQDRHIDNMPPQVLMGALRLTRLGAERIRAILKAPIYINSGFRCRELNTIVGGKPNSQHMLAEAIDFVCPTFGSPKAIFECLTPMVEIIQIDQLILEPSWVHASFSLNPRFQIINLT